MICSPDNGKCAGGCQAGWNGTTCKSECAAGTYGVNCNETCGSCLNGPNKCSKTDGLCSESCQAGWVGEKCRKECDSGFYGLNCSGTCGYCLNGSDTCLKSSGQCIGGCQAGWMGETCKSECVAGTHGINCSENCGHCLNGPNNCSKTEVLCLRGCLSGWMGEQCKQGSLGTRNPDDVCPNIGVIVGSVLAAVGVTNFTIVIVIVIVRRRRRMKMESGEANSENSTSAAHYMNVLADKPDTESNVAVSCNTEKETPFYSHVKACQNRDIQFDARKNHGEELEPDANVQNNYEKLQKGTQSADPAYSTLDHDLLNDNQKESMVIYQNCDKSFETAFKSVEKEISVLLSKKKKLLGDEHEKTRANLAEKLRHKKKEVETILSDKDEDYTFDNFFQTLETFERELKILEKCLLGRKGLLNHELNNITENRKK